MHKLVQEYLLSSFLFVLLSLCTPVSFVFFFSLTVQLFVDALILVNNTLDAIRSIVSERVHSRFLMAHSAMCVCRVDVGGF